MKKKIILYLPIILVSLFLCFSLYLFFNGGIKWHITNSNLMFFYNFLIIIIIILGYYVVARFKRSEFIFNSTDYLKTNSIKIIRIILILSLVSTIYYIFASIYTYIGFNNILYFLKTPGNGYDFFKLIQRAQEAGLDLNVPLYVRIGFWINLLLSGINFLVAPILFLNFKRLNTFEKSMGFTQIILNLIYGLIVGVKSIFFSFTVVFIFIFIIKIIGTINSEENRKKTKIIIKHISLIILSLIFLFTTFIIFQNNRQENYLKRTEVYNILFSNKIIDYFNIEEVYLYSIFGCEYTSKVNANTLEFIRSKSIKTSDFSICEIKDNPKLLATNNVENNIPNSNEQNNNSNNNNSLPVQPSYVTKFKSSVPDIVKFFEVRQDTFLPKVIGDDNYFSVLQVEYYITNGYLGQSLAHTLEHKSTFPLSSIKGILPYLNKIVNTDEIMKNSYEFRVYEKYGWSNIVYWSSAPTAFANDFTFIGAFIIYFLMGGVLALAWIKTIATNNYLYFTLFLILLVGLLFTPLNNYIGNSMLNINIILTILLLLFIERKKLL